MRAGRVVSIQSSGEIGGAELANVDLLEALRSHGDEVLLVTDQPALGAGTGLPVRVAELGPKLSRRSVGRVALLSPGLVIRLAIELRRARPVAATLVHFKKEQLLIALLPSRVTGRLIWAEWGPVPRPLRSGPGRRLYGLAARRAQTVLAVSEGTRRSVVSAGVNEDRVQVIPNLLDLERLRFDPAARRSWRARWEAGEGTFVIGCVSRLQRRKRNDVVIDAMARLPGDVMLVIAGDGDELDALRHRAAGTGARIRFEPSPRGHVAELMSGCDVLVFAPSPTEGAPRVVSEGQLVGRPVLATAPEGAGELIEPGAGTIVDPPHDPVALARELARYRDDPDRVRAEGERSHALARARHDSERIVAELRRALGLA